MRKDFSGGDNNKTPILAVLTQWLGDGALVLEVGSGSGQHAVHMAQALPSIICSLGLFGWVVGTMNNVSAMAARMFCRPLFSILH